MALNIEHVADGGMGREEPLRRAGRSKAATPTFPLSGRLMLNLRPIVRTAAGHMTICQSGIAQFSTAGSKPVGDDGVRHVSLPFHQLHLEFEGRLPIPPRLDEDVKNLALIVDGASEMVDSAPNPNEDLVQGASDRKALAGASGSLWHARHRT